MIAYNKSHTIAIYYGEGSWIDIIEKCLIPYIAKTSQNNLTIIMYLNNLKGDNIQIKYIGEDINIKNCMKQAKKTFLKYVNKNPSERKSSHKDQYFFNVPNNTVHYMNVMIEEKGVSINEDEQILMLKLLKSLPQTLINPSHKTENLDNVIFEICLTLNFLIVKILSLDKSFHEKIYQDLFNHSYLCNNYTDDYLSKLNVEFEANFDYFNDLYMSDEYLQNKYYNLFMDFCLCLKGKMHNSSEEYKKNLLMLIISEIDTFYSKKFNQYLFFMLHRYFAKLNN
ncbi:hypothetical protein M0L20_29735 [Spirosoma sp. RP8]|uniref:DUF4435 domain-containing protein n=1 Tax=Spirosoma liriopis TaxID=2937440 RepID=A0ABT0HX27_9BACT|nr:hypothetical protein [Spirosoma liriopis]MCK8496085.1 hypothetical protein [Spirosoma liriopis]